MWEQNWRGLFLYAITYLCVGKSVCTRACSRNAQKKRTLSDSCHKSLWIGRDVRRQGKREGGRGRGRGRERERGKERGREGKGEEAGEEGGGRGREREGGKE